MNDQNYFSEIILPSITSQKMPVKESYNLSEASTIMACSRNSLRQYARNYKNGVGSIRLKIEDNDTISYQTFVDFFEMEYQRGGTGQHAGGEPSKNGES